MLDLTAADVCRLRRTATVRPTGGYTDLAAAILANAHERNDGSARAELRTFEQIARFARQALNGSGGYQAALRRLGVRLVLDDGAELTGWRAAATEVDAIARRLAGEQMNLMFMNATTRAA